MTLPVSRSPFIPPLSNAVCRTITSTLKVSCYCTDLVSGSFCEYVTVKRFLLLICSKYKVFCKTTTNINVFYTNIGFSSRRRPMFSSMYFSISSDQLHWRKASPQYEGTVFQHEESKSEVMCCINLLQHLAWLRTMALSAVTHAFLLWSRVEPKQKS